MSLDDLKLSEIRKLFEVFGGKPEPEQHRDIGKKVIIRTYSAGVHFGTLVAKNGMEVILENAFRLWQWDGAFTLSKLALDGTSKPEGCTFSEPCPHITLEAIEIIGCTDRAIASLESVKKHVPQ